MDFEIPDELHFSIDDEWILYEDDTATVGVTDFAQQQLGDIVYVELPTVGDQIEEGVAFGVIESVKAVSDLNAPLTGEVVAVNESLDAEPERVNADVYGEGWLVELRYSGEEELGKLIDAEAYEKFASGG